MSIFIQSLVKRARWILTLAAAAGLLAAFVFSYNATAQRRRPARRPSPVRSKPGVDYSKFSHATAKHKQTCNTCHKMPIANWRSARGFPDVADYPSHDACVGCHPRQFFNGARPPICSVCHSKVSPRDDARFAFRNPAAPRQFTIEFPHDKHQDVIARLLQGFEKPELIFVRAGFTRSASPSADERKYNNCSICHAPRTDIPPAPAAGWTDRFVPDNLTFKAVPASHASCFNCHWKAEEPLSENCEGCHKPTTARLVVPAIHRISMKFQHEGGGETKNHVRECTTCHINITKSATLRGLKPDVPITACTECHNSEGLRLDVSKELEAIDSNRDFVCVYCHTSEVGKLDPPALHYRIAQREPRKRSDVK